MFLLPFLLLNIGFGAHRLNPPVPFQAIFTLSVRLIQRLCSGPSTKANLDREPGRRQKLPPFDSLSCVSWFCFDTFSTSAFFKNLICHLLTRDTSLLTFVKRNLEEKTTEPPWELHEPEGPAVPSATLCRVFPPPGLRQPPASRHCKKEKKKKKKEGQVTRLK